VPPFQRKSDHELDRLDDEALIAYIRAARSAGDVEAAGRAVATLVHGYWDNVARRVGMKVPPAQVEDVTADIVLSAIRSTFDGTSIGEFRAWLATITKRGIADFHRKVKRSPSTVPLVTDRDEPGASEPAATSEEGHVETLDVVSRVLAELSDPHRRIVELIVFEGRSARDAAEAVLGMTEDNAHQIVSRFRRALRRALEDGDTGGG
jgi:RNA polymerase sigma factor (sigma-70 family)